MCNFHLFSTCFVDVCGFMPLGRCSQPTARLRDAVTARRNTCRDWQRPGKSRLRSRDSGAMPGAGPWWLDFLWGLEEN